MEVDEDIEIFSSNVEENEDLPQTQLKPTTPMGPIRMSRFSVQNYGCDAGTSSTRDRNRK